MDLETEAAVDELATDVAGEDEIMEAFIDKLMSRDIICC
jgi:hypothetical protein